MRLTALLAIVLATTACSGGSSGATSAGSGPSAPTATVLPASGTVKLSDGITYMVAAPGATHRLDNLALRIVGLRWEKHVPVTVTPPGTRPPRRHRPLPLMSLDEYRRKRRPGRTPEPAGGEAQPAEGGRPVFVVQRHDARRLHYDLRLEMNGVLASWALPKGLPLE